MKILAVETSSSVAAVAVMDNGVLLGEYVLNHKMTHSEKLVPLITELMENLQLKPQDIDIYAVSTGPGSFTGLRIGIVTIKAIAYATKKPVVGIPTLDALAFNIPLCEPLIAPIMDARNSQVYSAVYKWEKGVLNNVTGYLAVHISELAEILKGKNQRVIFVGDAVPVHRKYLEGELGTNSEFAPAHLLLQRASSVAEAAYFKALKGEMLDCFELVPFYLRKSQAEREYEKRCRLGVN